MAFKINVSMKGRTFKAEVESEELLRNKIGDKISGSEISPKLAGYELEITGTSDSSGFPGFKGQKGSRLRKVLLKKGEKGIRDRRKGIRLKKSIRGEEISDKTSQINLKVLKEGTKKFDEICPPKPAKEKPGKEVKAEAKVEAKAEEKK